MIPRFLMLTSILAAALLLAGCGGDSPSDTPSARAGGAGGPEVDPRQAQSRRPFLALVHHRGRRGGVSTAAPVLVSGARSAPPSGSLGCRLRL